MDSFLWHRGIGLGSHHPFVYLSLLSIASSISLSFAADVVKELSSAKPTTSSSIYVEPQMLTEASNAVEPDASCAWVKNVKQVALQPGNNKFWQVDLQATKVITAVKLRATTLPGAF